jgi:hypothetical protein
MRALGVTIVMPMEILRPVRVTGLGSVGREGVVLGRPLSELEGVLTGVPRSITSTTNVS